MITSTFHTKSPSLLWWDDSGATAVDKIKAAARVYKRKFKFYPTSCYVNMDLRRTMPPTVVIGRKDKTTITVSRKAFMMPCYFQVQGE